ncbi:glycosyltransferase [bacterium]|nr:glycosyltransferase [bacterium]
MKPLVTAIVSTYKSSKFIRGCLDSLAEQTIVSKLEVIVVISGSPENEWEIAREYENRFCDLVLLHTGNREGLYTAWNRAIQIARGEFITNANTDDRLHTQALEKLSNVLLSDEKLGLVYGDCIQTENENETFATTSATEMLENQDYSYYDLHRHCFIGPCPMWRRKVHDIVGYFNDDKYWSAADFDFWLRMGAHFPMTHLRDTVGLFLNRKDSLAHMQIGKDESDAILKHYREHPYLKALFPKLDTDNSAEELAIAYTAMADICLEGPWQVDIELALEYLNLAAQLHPSLETDINRAVLLAMNCGFEEALKILSLHTGDPKSLHNIRWIDSLIKNQQTTSPIMIRTRHPFVIEAKKLHGVDPQEVHPQPLPLPSTNDPDLMIVNKAKPSVENRRTENSKPASSISVLMISNTAALDPQFPQASADIAMIQLARHLVKRGSRVTIAAPLMRGSGKWEGVEFQDLGTKDEFETALNELAPHFDVLIAIDRPEITGCALRFANLRKRILWLLSDSLAKTDSSPGELKRCTDLVVCTTEHYRSQLESCGMKPSRLRVIPLGIDPRVYYSRPVHRDHCRICFNGDLDSLSGADVLLEAFLKVKQSLPQAVLDIFGEPVDDANLIDFPLWKGKGVRFHGNASESRIAEAYSRSSLLVIPTRIQAGVSCGLNSLNAQACACPVLTTACAGAMDTIMDGVTGRVIEQDSSDALAGTIIHMLMDPLRLRIMGETGRAHVLQSYQWEHMSDAFWDEISEHEALEARPTLPQLKAPVRLGDPSITSHELDRMRSVRLYSKADS